MLSNREKDGPPPSVAAEDDPKRADVSFTVVRTDPWTKTHWSL
jgi:hypothetical protein